MLAYTETNSQLAEELITEAFCSSLGGELESKVKDREPTNLTDAYRYAVRIEARQPQLKQFNSSRKKNDDQCAFAINIVSDGEETGSHLRCNQNHSDARRISTLEVQVAEMERRRAETPRPAQRRQQFQGKTAENFETRKSCQPEGVDTSQPAPRCYYCRRVGHIRRDCPTAPPRQTATSRTFVPQISRMAMVRPVSNVVCYYCGGRGHYTRQCTVEKKTEILPKPVVQSFSCATGTPPTIKTHVVGYLNESTVPCEFLLDTGSERSILPSRLCRNASLRPISAKLIAANRTEIPVLGEVKMSVRLGGAILEGNFWVTDHINSGILGADFMTKHRFHWTVGEGEILVEGTSIPLVARQQTDRCCKLEAQCNITIPAMSEMIVPTLAKYDTFTKERHEYATEACVNERGLCIARSLLPPRCTNLPVCIMNISNQAVKVRQGQEIANLDAVTVVQTPSEKKEKVSEEFINDLVSKVDENISGQDKDQLTRLITEYQDVFSHSEYDLGRTGLVKHEIVTGDARPIRQALRPQPRNKQEEIDRQLLQMIDHGIIEPSQSPWSANLVVVTKKDSTLRLCIDYRMLNTVTLKDAYPLPRISECLDALGGMKYFSAFDLRSGYHQIELDETAKDKTSFVTKFGTFRFKVMSFGLCNAPATFQRLMDTVLSGLNFRTLLVYLDDIILFSRTVQEHFVRLKELLDCLRKANLKLKPSKCSLFQTEVEFLGHVVSEHGVRTDPKKIESVSTWPRPSSVREVRSFLGLASYYRRFVEHFAEKAGPLHALTHKNARFHWNEQSEEAFLALKNALVSSPILAMPLDEGRYYLDTDACNEAIGAVLQQEQGGEKRVIAYASRLMRGPELNYCVTRKELLAVVFFCKQFRNYLLGHQFTIRTDHSALQWLRRTPEPIGQQARWLEILEEFNFEILHRPGRHHGNADSLSRRPCRQCQMETAEVCAIRSRVANSAVPPVHTKVWSMPEIAEEQKKDVELASIYKFIRNPEDTVDVEKLKEDIIFRSYYVQRQLLVVNNDVLMRKWISADELSEKMLIVAPKVMREQLCLQAHQGFGAGHLGLKKTKARIRSRAYWVGRSTDIARFIQRCEKCNQHHRGTPPRQGKLVPTVLGRPFERVGLDITGRHPTSKNGFQYMLTIIDLFSKFAVAIPLRQHESHTVAEAFVTHWVALFGAPVSILTDQGPEFQSRLLSDLCKILGVEKLRTSAYKPSTNGGTERLHRTMNSMIAKTISENQTDWDLHVPAVMAAYRATVHESTGFTPNFVLFGQENRIALDIVLDAGTPEPAGLDAWVERKLELLRQAHAITRDHLGQAAERSKGYYDRRVKTRSFEVGELVYVYSPRRYVKRTPKWCLTYQGPFRVVRKLTDVNYVVQKNERSNSVVVHVDKLKKCLQTAPTEVAVEAEEDPDEEEEREEEGGRPRRATKRPAHLEDFVV